MVLIHIGILVFVLRNELLGNRLVIGDVEIIKFEIIFILVASIDVIVELSIDLLFLVFGWPISICHRLFHLESFETKSVLPVTVEFSNFFFAIKMRLGKLLTPKWSETQVDVFGERTEIVVFDHLLIVQVSTEGPNIIFINTMIDKDLVRVWRVSER